MKSNRQVWMLLPALLCLAITMVAWATSGRVEAACFCSDKICDGEDDYNAGRPPLGTCSYIKGTYPLQGKCTCNDAGKSYAWVAVRGQDCIPRTAGGNCCSDACDSENNGWGCRSCAVYVYTLTTCGVKQQWNDNPAQDGICVNGCDSNVVTETS